jgi:hypothetical protein
MRVEILKLAPATARRFVVQLKATIGVLIRRVDTNTWWRAKPCARKHHRIAPERPLDGPQGKHWHKQTRQEDGTGRGIIVQGAWPFSHAWRRLLTGFVVAGDDSDDPRRHFVGLISFRFVFFLPLVRASSRSHFRGSGSGSGSNMRFKLPCRGSVSSPRLASLLPCPAIQYSQGSKALGMTFAARAGAVPATGGEQDSTRTNEGGVTIAAPAIAEGTAGVELASRTQ